MAIMIKPGFIFGIGRRLAGILPRRLPTPYSLGSKVVVITGGSRGLGLAMAREFAREGLADRATPRFNEGPKPHQ